ncbi:hypothetical protein [Anoxybacter fermentans]|nr:hypothetical protein [Anoxybacter fermentans]
MKKLISLILIVTILTIGNITVFAANSTSINFSNTITIYEPYPDEDS